MIGVPGRLEARVAATAMPMPGSLPMDGVPRRIPLPLVATLLVAFPVFVQAPWLRIAPLQVAAFTAPLLALGILLQRQERSASRNLGVLLVGFSGCWLGGALFWGWCRLHPLWHLPVEGFALPLALTGLRTRWHLACSFYLASLVGTAATDGVMLASGLMDLWPQVLEAPLEEAPRLLQQAGLLTLRPWPIALMVLSGSLLLELSRRLWVRGGRWRVPAATLASTVAVDGLFLAAALLAPELSGLI